jgi:hypothetical protein
MEAVAEGHRCQCGQGRRERAEANLHGIGEDVRHARRENDTRSGRHAAQRVPDLPYLARQLSGDETWTDPQGGYPSGCRLSNGEIKT